MKRGLAWMLALTLLVGGAAACSDDDDGGDEATEQESGGDDSGDGGESGGNNAITEYCDAVEELVTKSEELAEDPTNTDLTTEIQELTTEVTEKGTALATEATGFDADDQAALQDCQDQFANIGTGG